MSPSASSFPFPRLAAIALIVAACALAGCGRKGALDLPPGASAQEEGYVQPQIKTPSTGVLGGGGTSSRTPIIAPRGPNKRIPLDALLD